MLVLGKDAQIGVRGHANAGLLEVEAGLALAARPQVYGRNLMRSRDNGVGEIELSIELERAGLNGERARGCARLGGLVHDPHPGSEPGQPKGEDKAGWTGANDQDIACLHVRLLKIQARRNQIQIGRNKIQAERNKNKIRRNKIQEKIRAPAYHLSRLFNWLHHEWRRAAPR